MKPDSYSAHGLRGQAQVNTMTESIRTGIYVAMALLIATVAYATRTRPPEISPDQDLGAVLFPDFTDPLAVTSLEIVRFDELLKRPADFKIEKVDGVWSIASHGNYPADAKDGAAAGPGPGENTSDRVSAAAANLIDLKILGVVSDKASEHELYGVIEPNSEKTNEVTQGVGTLVVLKNAKGEDLARMILGKQDDKNSEIRFVRKAGQDRVYTVKVDAAKLSTRFGDWIEKDLLQIGTLKSVQLNDYAIVAARGGDGVVGKALDERASISFNHEGSKWTLKELKTAGKEGLQPVALGKDERPNAKTLDALKAALDSLQIVNVEQKPESLAGPLRQGTPLQKLSQKDGQALMERGYYPIRNGANYDLYADSGEILVQTADGVEYIVRFGEISSTTTDASLPAAPRKKAGDDKSLSELNLNRYIMVSARLNEAGLEKPVKAPLPLEPKPTPAAPVPSPDDPLDAPRPKEAGVPQEEPLTDAARKAKDEAAKQKWEAEKKRIEDEFVVETDAYKKKVEEARKKVRLLNQRFGGWFYVIPESTYKKIHLSQKDVIEKFDPSKPANDAPADGASFPGLPNMNFPGLPQPGRPQRRR